MNAASFRALLRKELRSVALPWVVVMLALGLPAGLNASSLGLGSSAWNMVVLVVGSFGVSSVLFAREFQDRTLGWSLLQPLDRRTVLGSKLLIAATLQGGITLVYVLIDAVNWGYPASGFQEFWLTASVVAVASPCLLALLARNVLTTLVVSMIVPYLLMLLMLPLLSDQWTSRQERLFMVGVLLGYSLVCLVLGSWLWRRLQVKEEAAPVSVLDVAVIRRVLGDQVFRRRPAWLALVRKELGLLRFVFWLSALFVLGAAVFILADHYLTGLIAAGGPSLTRERGVVWWQDVLRTLSIVLFAGFAVLVPLLSGGMVFAEETHLGSRHWQRCQPVTTFQQWAIKVGVAAAVSALGGLVLPLLVAAADRAFHLDGGMPLELEPGIGSQVMVIHGLLFGLAAWTATLCRTSITAIVMAAVALITLLVLNVQLSVLSLDGLGRNYVMPDWRMECGLVALVALMGTLPNYGADRSSVRRSLWQGAILAVVATGAFLVQVTYISGW